MKRSFKRLAAASVTGAVIAPIPALMARPAGADICCNSDWATVAATLQQGSQQNEVGFWQDLIFSNGICPLTNDGKFGSQTFTDTKLFQEAVDGFTGSQVDGIAGVNTWHDTEYASYYIGGNHFNRLTYSGDYYSYYGGGPADAQLYFAHTGSSNWKFQQPESNTWYNATTALTQGSHNSC
jgi:hypothetical protein